jgi:acetyl-CoA carboxylase carboxyltransferase component
MTAFERINALFDEGSFYKKRQAVKSGEIMIILE